MKAAILAGLFAWGTGIAFFIADEKKSPPATPQPTVADEGLPKKKRRISGEDTRTPPAAVAAPRTNPNLDEHIKANKAQDDIDAVLDQATFADFSDTPLRQVLMFISTQHNMRIYIDENGLANAMVDRDQGVTLQMAGVRLSLLLDFLLEPLNLDYAVRENVLFISSRERIESLRSTAVLRIGDMLNIGGDTKEEAERLVNLITENIDRDGWSASGGENVIQFVEDARSLVVTSNGKTQRKISKLLSDLRSAKLANGMPAKKGEARVAAN